MTTDENIESLTFIGCRSKTCPRKSVRAIDYSKNLFLLTQNRIRPSLLATASIVGDVDG